MVSTLILTWFLATGLWSFYQREIETNERVTTLGKLDFATKGIENDLQSIVSIATHFAMEMPLMPGGGFDENLKTRLTQLAGSNPFIEQVRLIDLEGHEKIRVSKTEGEIVFAPENKLEDKSGEGYFQVGKGLKPNQFYIGPIALNQKSGAPQDSPGPVLRLVFPYLERHTGTMDCLLVINLNPEGLLRQVSEIFTNSGFDIYLADENGSLVVAPNENLLWGADLGHENVMGALFPAGWEDIRQTTDQSVESGDSVFYLKKFMLTPFGAEPKDLGGFRFDTLETPPDLATTYYLVAVKDRQTFLELLKGKPFVYGLITFLLLTAIILFSWNGGVLLARRQSTYQNLAESEKQLRQIMDSLVEGLVIFNPNGEIETINKAASTIWGYSKEEISGKPVTVLMAEETAQFFQKNFNHYLSTGVARVLNQPPMEMVGRKKDGTTIYGDVSVTEINEDGGRVFIASVRDTTETRKLKARYRILTEEARDIVVLNSPDLKPAYVSPAVRRVLGYTQDEYMHRKPFEFVHPDDLSRVIEAHEKLLKTKKHQDTIIFRALRKDGAYIWVESVVRPVLATDGEIESFITNIRDVNNRMEMEKHLRDSHKAEALNQITSGISHEFNNLLMAISGGLSLIKDDKNLTETQIELIELALKSSQRGAQLVRDMLSYSRKQALKPVNIELGAFIKKLAPKLKNELAKGISLGLEVSGKPLNVSADPRALETVLFNLIENADDAIGAKGKITICAKRIKLIKTKAAKLNLPAGAYAAVSVHDNGKGMEAEDLARAFDPFFTTKEVNEGKGLGLSMVYGFAQQSGGTAKIESLAGKGTTVTLYLPVGKL